VRVDCELERDLNCGSVMEYLGVTKGRVQLLTSNVSTLGRRRERFELERCNPS
jgi:hypothetical protein